ncbi:hypothetical protein FAIPA1_10345 [Frankia sp. AiPs1]
MRRTPGAEFLARTWYYPTIEAGFRQRLV